MSPREKRREIIFGIAYSIMSVVMLFGTITTGRTDLAFAFCAFAIIAAISWIKLAVHAPGKKNKKERPVKQNAAQLAREAELEALKKQQEEKHRLRREAYLAEPVPMQIRQWSNVWKWESKYDHCLLNRPIFIRKISQNSMGFSPVTFNYMDRCRIYRKEDGIWYLQPVAQGIQVRMNQEVVRKKCEGLPVNTQEFSVARGAEQELLPGDCITIIDGPGVFYFRVDRL